MTYAETCECCDHTVRAYMVTLTPSLVKCLDILAATEKKKGRGISLMADLNLSNNDYCNFQKLRYFGLAYNHHGFWRATKQGKKFLLGLTTCRNKVIKFKNKTVSLDHPAWDKARVMPKLVYFQQVKYKQEKHKKRNYLYATAVK